MDYSVAPSRALFYPRRNSLHAYRDSQNLDALQREADQAYKSIQGLVMGKDYPCVAAIRSFAKEEFRVGLYQDFGTGRSSLELGNDLLVFLSEQKASKSPYLSLFAVFPGSKASSEEEFESQLWNELSCVASRPEFQGPWDPSFSSEPSDKGFCFSLGGSAFFVVGLHPKSSRVSRRFPYPAMIFNVYDQFRQLAEEGKYEAMVEVNRKKDVKYQGSVNPMAEKYGDVWEAIQFSGRDNRADWKCPFRHGAKPVPEKLEA